MIIMKVRIKEIKMKFKTLNERLIFFINNSLSYFFLAKNGFHFCHN